MSDGGTPIIDLRRDINPNITPLINNINDNLRNGIYNNENNFNDETDETDGQDEYDTENDTTPLQINSKKSQISKLNRSKQNKNNKSYIPKSLYEPLLLLILFLIISSNLIKNLLSSKIKIMELNEYGDMSYMGLIIYGVIFVILFMIIRKYICD